MRVEYEPEEMVCGQLVLKLLYFFIDTNLLDVNSTLACDWMDVDSNAEDEGNSNLSQIKIK